MKIVRARRKIGVQPGLGVEGLGHDAGDGIDGIEFGAVGEGAGRDQRAGHAGGLPPGAEKLKRRALAGFALDVDLRRRARRGSA